MSTMKFGLAVWLVCAVWIGLAAADCISDPTQPSCASFQLPANLIDPNVTMLCEMMPQMPGCTLQTVCARGVPSFISSSAYCDRFVVLKTLCDDMDMGGCDGYYSMCRTGSVVAQCNQTHLPLLGTDKTYDNIVAICTATNATQCHHCQDASGFTQQCDLWSTYSDLCEVAPAMAECSGWKAVCLMPGMTNWPLCGAQVSCVDDPTQHFCANFTLAPAAVNASITTLCDAMSNMPGCSLRTMCQTDAAASQSSYCDNFAILKVICTDMPRMRGCGNYTAMCTTQGSIVQQCQQTALTLPSTMNTASMVKSICTEMYMTECEQCPGKNGPGTGSNCDLLGTYSGLCLDMPDMSQCSTWKSFCTAIPQWPWCDANANSDPRPPMVMYFHVGIVERILFWSWVPTTPIAFTGSWFIIFIASALYEALKLLRKKLEEKWEKKIEDIRNNSPSEESEPLNSVINSDSASTPSWYSFPPFVASIDFPRSIMSAVEMTLSLLIMLVAMTYNVALFFAIPAGTMFGTLLFGRFMMGYKPPSGCCS